MRRVGFKFVASLSTLTNPMTLNINGIASVIACSCFQRNGNPEPWIHGQLERIFVYLDPTFKGKQTDYSKYNITGNTVQFV